MELITNKYGILVFKDENEQLYTMLNMAPIEKWYETPKSLWRLMQFENLIEEKNIKADVAGEGNYQRLYINFKEEARMMIINDGMVTADFAWIKCDEDTPKTIYTSKCELFDKPENIGDYLLEPRMFTYEGKQLESPITKPEVITDFLNKNAELVEIIKETNKSRK